MRRFLCSLAGGFIACASPPTHFFTLSTVAPVGRIAAAPGYPIQVAAFHLPQVLDRKEIVHQDSKNTLAIEEQDHWGAPLDEMALNVLTEDLSKRLPAGTIILPGAPAPPSAAYLVVDIASFRETADGQVRLDGSWTLLRGDPAAPVIRREVALAADAVRGDTASQVATMSALIGRLADQIAAELAGGAPVSNPVLSTRKGV